MADNEKEVHNGSIAGSDLGISGRSNEQDEKDYGRVGHEGGTDTVKGDTGGGAHNGSKIGSALGTDGSADNAGGRGEGSADGRDKS